jgi:4-hydroxybenzoate polyprenyltransferase
MPLAPAHPAPTQIAPVKRANEVKPWFVALRLHHWLKNLVVFLPLLLSHQFHTVQVVAAFQTFAAFSFCASAFYVFNDLLDVEADRLHVQKRARPFAADELGLRQGIVLISIGLAAAFLITSTIPLPAQLYLLLYAAVSGSYSLWLKQLAFLDVVLLAALYAFRLLAGGAAETIPISPWTLAFCTFLFLGLALIKRLKELVLARAQNRVHLARRGYTPSDIPSVRAFATVSLYLSAAVFAFYINSGAVSKLYRHPQILWVVCVLFLYWVQRVVRLANLGQMTDDPVVFAFADRASQIVVLLVAASVVLAL